METNWSGNYHYQADRLHRPSSLEALQERIRKSDDAHILGTRHSFNSIADTTGELISLDRIPSEMSLDTSAETVTVTAGLEYGTVAQQLHESGYALHNLASLPHISVGGACATATHGSGVDNGNLATAVSELDLVTGTGERVSLTRDDEQFYGAAVGLGALGAITHLTLDVEPTFQVRQHVYTDLSLGALRGQFEALMASAYSVSLFTDFRDRSFNQVWIKDRVDEGDSFPANASLFDARRADEHLNPVPNQPPKHCTRQLGQPGPWHRRLPHFRMAFTPSSGDELQTEYFVPFDRGVEAVEALLDIREEIAPHLLISEVRTIAADELWMSPAYRQPSVALHFTWKPDGDAVRDVLPLIEERLAPLNARPHWGKVFTLPPDVLQSRIARLDDFRELAREYDPHGTFRNDFLDTYVF